MRTYAVNLRSTLCSNVDRLKYKIFERCDYKSPEAGRFSVCEKGQIGLIEFGGRISNELAKLRWSKNTMGGVMQVVSTMYVSQQRIFFCNRASRNFFLKVAFPDFATNEGQEAFLRSIFSLIIFWWLSVCFNFFPIWRIMHTYWKGSILPRAIYFFLAKPLCFLLGFSPLTTTGLIVLFAISIAH